VFHNFRSLSAYVWVRCVPLFVTVGYFVSDFFTRGIKSGFFHVNFFRLIFYDVFTYLCVY